MKKRVAGFALILSLAGVCAGSGPLDDALEKPRQALAASKLSGTTIEEMDGETLFRKNLLPTLQKPSSEQAKLLRDLSVALAYRTQERLTFQDKKPSGYMDLWGLGPVKQ